MHVVVAGASGLIGSALVDALRARGDEVTRLVRREPTSADERQWDPSEGALDPAHLAGADAVVGSRVIEPPRWRPPRPPRRCGRSEGG